MDQSCDYLFPFDPFAKRQMYGLEKIACITRMCTNPVIIVKYICLYIFKEIKKYCVLKHNGNLTLLCEILSIGKKGQKDYPAIC